MIVVSITRFGTCKIGNWFAVRTLCASRFGEGHLQDLARFPGLFPAIPPH